MKLKSITIGLLLGTATLAYSQTPRDAFHDADGNTFHQLFLDFKAAELLELKYAADDCPLDGTLSSDGYSVLIKNYPGDKSVKAVVVDQQGNRREITKSRCFIDPLLLEL